MHFFFCDLVESPSASPQLLKSQKCVAAMGDIKRIHMIGIGGRGMSGIAEVLVSEGYQISGSDWESNALTQHLSNMGVQIFSTYEPENIKGADVVVKSNAIAPNNAEIVAAEKSNIPIIHRAEMLAEIMRFRHGIAIVGTHGKTTTTAMVANIFVEAALDSTFIDGGLVKNFGGNFENVTDASIKFVHNLPFCGHVVMCIDDPVIRELLSRIDRRTITYGFSGDHHIDADFHIAMYNQQLNVPGRHNALNADAAIAIAMQGDIDDGSILRAMKQFQGTGRRFENLSTYSLEAINGKSGEVLSIDDYGHHPTELNATIPAARDSWPNKRLSKINPILVTDTNELPTKLAIALQDNDLVLMLGSGIGNISRKLADNKLKTL
ncbi:UDP-N-acetylmuramate--L-alanine ligase-like [Sitodiplosis mosellana]|uniref:UDP-N-acetylmuramate--L-alanine ligase-like n=1 Tax=Sitodiplosis mosellana TaxID=263140 RepID=UPI002444D317|nr:UDP-N-acetylmuramate--L-alanine ligase-like [Sitodiplosis mosellana]